MCSKVRKSAYYDNNIIILSLRDNENSTLKREFLDKHDILTEWRDSLVIHYLLLYFNFVAVEKKKCFRYALHSIMREVVKCKYFARRGNLNTSRAPFAVYRRHVLLSVEFNLKLEITQNIENTVRRKGIIKVFFIPSL